MARSVPPPAMEPGKDPYLGAVLARRDGEPVIILERHIGGGGMSVVYATKALPGHPARAVKMLKHELLKSEEALARFGREARILERLGEHQHILPVIEYGIAKATPFQGEPYIVMPLVRGKTVEDMMADARDHGVPGRFPLEYAVKVIGDVCSALIAAHEHVGEDGRALPIIHRDVKPSNVFVEEQRGATRVMLADFGIARFSDPAVFKATLATDVNTIVGTPCYMAPEQALCEPLTPAADVYAVGVMVYEMLSGRLPIEERKTDDTESLLRRIVVEPPRPLKDVIPSCPAALDALVMRALCKSPKDRPSIREFRDGLSAATGAQVNRSVRPSAEHLSSIGVPRLDLTPPKVPLDLPALPAPGSKPPTVGVKGVGVSADEDAETREWSRGGEEDGPSSGRLSFLVFAVVLLLMAGGIGLMALSVGRGEHAGVTPVARHERPDAGVRLREPPEVRPDAGTPLLVEPAPPRPVAVVPRATAPPVDPALDEHHRLCRAEVAARAPSTAWLGHCAAYLAARCAEADRPVDCGLIEIRVRQEAEARRRARERRRREREEPEPDTPSADGE